MDYRKIAQSELENINIISAALTNIKSEMNEVNAALRSVKTSKIDGATGGSFDPFAGENRTVSLLMRKDEINQRFRQARTRYDRINSALNVLPPQDRELLLACFRDGIHADDIMESLGYERTAFYNRRSEALERFTRAMFGVILT